MMTVTFSQVQGMTVGEAIAVQYPDYKDKTLAVLNGGQVLEWGDPAPEGKPVRLIDYTQEEGRRIYERSLRLVLLAALDRLYPGERVCVEYSAGRGVYWRMPDRGLSRAELKLIKQEMTRIIEADTPFQKKVWHRKDAQAYFEKKGRMDQVRLLENRPYEHFTMYALGDFWAYFYGAMTPSAGWVSVFDLKPHAPGAVLMLPDVQNPQLPAPHQDQRKLLNVFAQSQQWCDVLEVENAVDLIDMMKAGQMRRFIRINEALHDRSIAGIADEVYQRRARAVFVAGPSSSGKTTFTNRLAIHLQVLGLRPVILSLDDFYRDRDTLTPLPDGTLDLETIDALDIPYLNQCLEQLMLGKEALMPSFDFTVSKRRKELTPLQLKPDQPLLIEGIHGLNPSLMRDLPEEWVYRVSVSALTCLNLDDYNRIRTTDVRLLRRVVRDWQFRNTPSEETLAMWESVRRGEDRWIFPYQENADSLFNTTLHYELPVLKRLAYEPLKAIQPESPQYLLSRRLLKILHYLPAATDEEVAEIPPLSILREFVGGCSFYD